MTSDLPSNEELIAAIQDQDVYALEEFYDRHRVIAYSLALRLLGNPHDAEEVVQESFLSVWRSSATYRVGRGAGRSWVLSIVHHRAVDKLRGRQTRPDPVVLDESLNISDGTDVWREVSETLTAEAVRRALGQLPAEQREAIELAYFKGYTHVQIAELTGAPLGTVKGRMRIGLHRLRAALERKGLAIDEGI
ncbi:MAG: RNA polymerase sigma factor [Chloroflexota bacterium]